MTRSKKLHLAALVSFLLAGAFQFSGVLLSSSRDMSGAAVLLAGVGMLLELAALAGFRKAQDE